MEQGARVDEALDRLAERDECADEDREHDCEPGEPLAAQAAQEEREPERNRGERVAEVVDQVGEQRHAERARVDERLRERGHCENDEAQRDRADAGAGTQDRPVDEAVGMLVLVFMVVLAVFRFGEPKRWDIGLM